MATKQKTPADLVMELKKENERLKKENEKLLNSSSSDSGSLLIQYKSTIEELNKEHENELRALKEELAKVERKNILLGDKADRTREVLKLSAFGFAAGNIHSILNKEKGIDISLQDVIRIVDNIDNMPPDEYKFYNDCKKDFTDKVTIDPSFFTTTVYKKYMLLESTLSEQLARAKELDDVANIHKFTESLMKLYGEMAKVFAKNGIDIKRESELDKINNDIISTPKEKTSNSIKFGKLKVSGN